MSSLSYSYNRKRTTDESSISDSEDEEDSPPVKRFRQNGTANILVKKIGDIVSWIAELPFKNFIKDTSFLMYNSTTPANDVDDADAEFIEEIINVEDDDPEDVKEINVEDYDPEDVKVAAADIDPDEFEIPKPPPEGLFSARLKKYYASRNKSQSQNSFGISSNPLSTSTPFYATSRTLGDGSRLSSVKSPTNGFHTSQYTGSSYNSSARTRRMSPPSRVAPISNPGMDVDILLDGTEEADVELMSGLSTVPSMTLARRTMNRFTSDSNDIVSSDRNGDCDEDETENFSFARKPQTTDTYTAHELVRLHERDQYRLLIDKMIKTSIYHPVVSKRNSESPKIEVDLTEDDEEPVTGFHFARGKKESQVNEFLETYYPTAASMKRISETSSHITLKQERLPKDVQFKDSLPQYRPRPKSTSALLSDDWINEFKMRVSEMKEDRIRTIAGKEEKLERFHKKRDARLAERKRLQYFNLDAFEEKEEEKEFPPLTAEMENVIDSLYAKRPNEIIGTIDREEVTRNDISTLLGINWLNDQIINFYMTLIVERGKRPDYPSVYAFKSFFYTSYKARGFSQIQRWTRKIDVFAYDILLFPFHLDVHWALVVADNRTKEIKYYDSMHSSCLEYLRIVHSYLTNEMKDKKKMVMDSSLYEMAIVKDLPYQENGGDCGMFCLKYAEFISRDAPLTFTQNHMSYFRRRMVYEIHTGEIL